MYNFSKQQAMLEATLMLLEENNLLDSSSLGGGTALAAYYWNHRYSTDIDIFLYAQKNVAHLLKPSFWSEKITNKMFTIGYDGNFKHNDIYTEIGIDQDSKIQFFDVVKKSKKPYAKGTLWGFELLIDSVEEIIAKKIYFRGNKGNSRDLFDIAVAFHKMPDFLKKTTLKQDKIIQLYKTIAQIKSSNELSKLYLQEIKLMNPTQEYVGIAIHAIEYLQEMLENVIGAYNIGYELSSEDFVAIENEIFLNTIPMQE